MKKIADDEYYFKQYQNDNGYTIGLHRVMFGYRVVIFSSYWGVIGDFCGGDNIAIINRLYSKLYRWLATNRGGLDATCSFLSKIEATTQRPMTVGNKLDKALLRLPQAKVEAPIVTIKELMASEAEVIQMWKNLMKENERED